MIDRVNPQAAARIFAHLFPGVRIRNLCVRAMADSITRAHAAAPQGWGVTLLDNMVRLNVGRIEVMTFTPDWVHLVLDSRCFPETLRDRQQVELLFQSSPHEKGVFRSVPVSASCGFPAKLAGELFPLVRSSHHSLIGAAGDTTRNAATRIGLFTAVIEFLSAAVAQHLDHPLYHSEKQRGG